MPSRSPRKRYRPNAEQKARLARLRDIMNYERQANELHVQRLVLARYPERKTA